MLVVNPRTPLGADDHVVLWGRALRYCAPPWPGPLSIKSVISGRAVWTTEEARHEVGDQSYLVVNDSHPYSIEIDAPEPVETFCVFFPRGFVEAARLDVERSDEVQLDDPGRAPSAAHFHESLQPRRGRVGAVLGELRSLARSPRAGVVRGAEDTLVRLARALCREGDLVSDRRLRIDAVKASTRDEILRRVSVVRDLIDSSLDESLRLQDLARAACLSPFHLHRHFTRTLGETPQAYRSRRRMERAAQALRGSRIPVTEIALDAGFSSLGSFSSLFKRQFGVSPRRFRDGG